MYGYSDKPATDRELYVIELLEQVIRSVKEQKHEYALSRLKKAEELLKKECRQEREEE